MLKNYLPLYIPVCISGMILCKRLYYANTKKVNEVNHTFYH
jgi:hypothetical protein